MDNVGKGGTLASFIAHIRAGQSGAEQRRKAKKTKK